MDRNGSLTLTQTAFFSFLYLVKTGQIAAVDI